jgi:ABC-type uncharacterized transport system involved in gliding motility auxiliary subunit
MNTRHDQPCSEGEPADAPVQQQQQQPQGESHAGQGSESAMKQMRVWEQHRASNSGGPGRQGPG